MTTAETLTLASYFFVLIILAVYGWHRYYLVYLYLRNRDKEPKPGPTLSPQPVVTIQLPLYNEMYVADRLIAAVCAIDYPRELVEIQVLDDSVDETRSIAESAVRRFAAQGVDIKYFHREDRVGFKAGALEAGLKTARGEFICIFDADFIPTSDFLRRLMPHFRDPGVGMVQARWGHINQDYSLLTKIQAILLDGHFILEHGGRHRGGRFFNFNGTAGVWRRQAIDEAGGWEHDTLTEDLDLSYRAQLRGWQFVFVPGVIAPAEVPFLMSVGIGLSVNNTRAVFEALFNKQSEFTRTPKYRIEADGDEWVGKRYRQSVAVQPLVELALGLYFTATVFYALANGIYGTLPFLVLFQIGFLYTGLLSVVQQFAGDGVVLKTQVEVDQ